MNALNWALVGGGEGSQIGFAHRAASGLDGRFRFVAGALDVDPERARAFGVSLGLAPDRAYGDWRQMLAMERHRDDRQPGQHGRGAGALGYGGDGELFAGDADRDLCDGGHHCL